MKRPTRTVPSIPALYARIRETPNPYTKLLKVEKGHALRDEFSAVRTATGATNRYWKIAVSAERGPISDATRSQLKALQTRRGIFDAPGQIFDALRRKSRWATQGGVLPPIRHAARGESWYPGYDLPGARRERASHGG